MKKGFPADESTPGGRVRKCRLDAGYTIKDLALLIGVSPNHLGLVERGEKQASFKLLQKISEITDTPYQWIVKGAQKKADDIIAPDDTIEDLNLQLFFGLVLAMAPAVNKEVLASLLNTSVETVDSILRGESVERDLQWPGVMPSLANLLGDIPTVRGHLKTLDTFLAEVEYDRSMNVLKENLIKHLYDNYGIRYKLYPPIRHESHRHVSEKDSKEFLVKWTNISFYDAERPKMFWTFRLFQSELPIEYCEMQDIFNFIADLAESMSQNLSVIFTLEDDYDNFSSIANSAMSRVSIAEAGCAEIGMPISQDEETAFCNLSYALVDSKTWQIQKFDTVNPY